MILTIVTTLAVTMGVREAWRQTEERRFADQFATASQLVEQRLSRDVSDLPKMLRAVCDHDSLVDAALVDVRARRLDAGRRLALSARVQAMQKALRVDELVLLTHTGEILGASKDPSRIGKRDKALAKRVRQGAAAPKRSTSSRVVEAACFKAEGGSFVGLYATRDVDGLLKQVAATYGMQLSDRPPPEGADLMVRDLQIKALSGLTIHASRSRVPLAAALKKLDGTIFLIGGVTVASALLIAFMLARGLARPIVDLSEQAGRVVHGEPQPVAASGGKELVELANSFNKALSDLADLRKRLAATERIAARREIARRVAHEIKNPLAPIQAAVETLRRLRARDDPAFDEYFDEATRTVLSEVGRISQIVAEFTRFARLPPPDPAPIDITDAVTQVVNLHRREDVELVFDDPGPIEISADRNQVVQVVTNLVQNAIDAALSAQSPRVSVRLVRLPASSRGRPRVELTVRNNGSSVPEEIVDRLFEPYVTSKPKGTGLGLAIVQRIAIEHGGDVRYRAPRDAGAEFTLELPVDGPTLLSEAPPSERVARKVQ